MLHLSRHGYSTILLVSFFVTLSLLLTWFFYNPAFYFSLIPLSVIEILVINFFRDPERLPPTGDHLVIAPADGKVIKIETITDHRYLKTEVRLVSIFMNVFDVHVNRVPVKGVVKHVEFIPGKFLSAYKEEASIQNEQAVIGIESDYGLVFFKQISGLVARRIICQLQNGQAVHTGERMGIIKFGSRVDLLLPLHADIAVKIGDRVKSGISIIATLNKS